MESLIEVISHHAPYAHWTIFGLILLAGFNVPISADLMVILSAVLAATIVPDHTIHLFLAVYIGCYLSAMIAYWVGRLVGPRLCELPLFSKLLTPSRLNKIKSFYDKHGLLTLLVGRFIPFGVRNCLFFTSGITRMPFTRFILYDFFACTLWACTAFWLFYFIGQNIQTLWHYVKTFNLIIFSAFGVTVIGTIWYKMRKKGRLSTPEKG